jgi:hypothetical protein
MHDAEASEITVDLKGCARCDGDGHPNLTFKRFVRPVDAVKPDFTHWASCPTNGDPILMQVFEDEPDSKVPPSDA